MSYAVSVIDEPRHHLALDTPISRVYWVELPSGDATLLHRHSFDYVTVVIGDAFIGNQHRGEKEVLSRVPDGHTFYSRAPFEHIVRNAGDKPFLNFTISMLRNGAGPRNQLFEALGLKDAAGNINWEPLFDERCARAAKVRLSSAQAIELDGDNIVVTRHPDAVEVSGSSVQRIERAATLFWCTDITRLTTSTTSDLVVIGIH